ncbi:MAG: hypothetical protein K5639_02965 [Eubacterium sp.]|nr:hypothetical protein [Eubacterium sp.]
MKEILKNIFTKNLGWKLLSLIAAALFWIVALNIIDPNTKKTFNDIPVEILNESVITSADQVYEVVSGDKVNVTISGKRSFVEKLTADDFSATADLTELSSVNAVNIKVKLVKPPANAQYELSWGNAVLKVNLEKRVTNKYKVSVNSEGELGEGYVLSETQVKPNIVEVSGGESKMKKIDKIEVTIPLTGQTEDFTTKATPMAYDRDGDLIDSTNLTFSVKTVKVSVSVGKTMDVPIRIETKGEPAEGYRLVTTDRQPESVKVTAADSSLLKNDLAIVLEVDIAGAKADVEKEFNITNVLGDAYTIVDDITVVSVRCEIAQSGKKTLSLTSTDIEVRNLSENHTVEFAEDDKRYKITLTGSDSDLEKIDIKSLGAYINLSGMTTGAHDVEVKFDLPDGVKLSHPLTVRIILVEQSQDEPTEEPDEE